MKMVEETFDAFVNNIKDISSDYTYIDSSYNDNYIDFRLNYVDTLQLTEEGYNKYEELVRKYDKILRNIEVYLSNDVSGHAYWTINQEESNYLHLVVTIKENSTVVMKDEIIKLKSFMDTVSKKYIEIAESNKVKSIFTKTEE